MPKKRPPKPATPTIPWHLKDDSIDELRELYEGSQNPFYLWVAIYAILELHEVHKKPVMFPSWILTYLSRTAAHFNSLWWEPSPAFTQRPATALQRMFGFAMKSGVNPFTAPARYEHDWEIAGAMSDQYIFDYHARNLPAVSKQSGLPLAALREAFGPGNVALERLAARAAKQHQLTCDKCSRLSGKTVLRIWRRLDGPQRVDQMFRQSAGLRPLSKADRTSASRKLTEKKKRQSDARRVLAQLDADRRQKAARKWRG